MFATMAQQVEHVLGKDEVTGSNPVSSSTNTADLFCGVFFVCIFATIPSHALCGGSKLKLLGLGLSR